MAQEPPSLRNLHLSYVLLETKKGGRGAELTSGARTRIPPARRGGEPPAAARIAGSRRADEVDARSWPLEAEKIPSQSPQGLERSTPHPLQQNKRATNKEDIGTHTARRIHFKRTAALTERSEPRSLRYSTLTQDQATRDWFAIAGSISFADELHL